MGRIYFRSDTRSPAEIFKKGFSPRNEIGDLWWSEAIRFRGYKDNCGIQNQAIDADASVCICMTTKLESAPLFPLNDEDSYIYAIALPKATKIDYLNSTERTSSVTLLRDDTTPTDLQNIVLDLHSFQTRQTKNIYSFFTDTGIEDENIAAYAGWPLYAYEAVAYKIPSSAIICAVKCKRELLKNQIEINCDSISLSPKKSLDRQFTLEEDIILNENFSLTHHLWTGKGMQNKLSSIDYSLLKNEVIKQISQVRDKGIVATPNIYYGLGGKTF